MFDISRRRAIQILAGSGAMAAVTPIAPAFGQQLLQWGSGSLGSTGYVIIEALTSTVNRQTELRNTSMSTAGGPENIALMQQGLLQFGQTTSSDWKPALDGAAPYGSPVDLRQILNYTIWQVSPIVRADSDIHTLADLAGRRVMPAAAGNAAAVLYNTLFEAAGIDVNWTYGSWRESYDAMAAGTVDAIPLVLVNGRPSPLVTELLAAREIRVLPIEDEVLARAEELNSGVLSAEVRPEVWDVIPEPMNMISYAGILASTPDVDDDVVYEIVKTIYENEQTIQNISTELQDIRIDFATRHLMTNVPVHPGAARYFQEAGVWRDDLIIG